MPVPRVGGDERHYRRPRPSAPVSHVRVEMNCSPVKNLGFADAVSRVSGGTGAGCRSLR